MQQRPESTLTRRELVAVTAVSLSGRLGSNTDTSTAQNSQSATLDQQRASESGLTRFGSRRHGRGRTGRKSVGHWIVWNISPEIGTIPEDWSPENAVEGTNDFGEIGYGGPNPPDSKHRYRFKLYALDTKLDLPAKTDAKRLGTAMNGHILARTQLAGTYPA